MDEKTYAEILDLINKRTNGEFSELTISDKILLKKVAEEELENITRTYNEIKSMLDMATFWHELDIDDEIAIEKTKNKKIKLHEVVNFK